jgi:hypothetical protein
LSDPTSRIRLLENISRARGDHLYAAGGRRYLDLYRDGGRAILGYRSGRIVRERKNVLEKGLSASLPSSHEARLERALRRLFPSARAIRMYASYDAAIAAVASFLGLGLAEVSVADPVIDYAEISPGRVSARRLPFSSLPFSSAPANLWRPFMPHDLSAALDTSTACILPVLPVPGEMTQVVLFPDGQPPASDLIPADRLVSMERAIYDLQLSGEIESLPLPGFYPVGPYLVPYAIDESIYNEWFTEFVGNGILISPDQRVPSVSPFEVSDGERARALQIATAIVGKEEPLRGD